MNDFLCYGAAHEETMWMFSRALDEDHRRRYAAIEALKIGQRIELQPNRLDLMRATLEHVDLIRSPDRGKQAKK
ncbi:hypothetical protein THIOKS12640016 [Thiocapsa sp. KS1]|nr:hypothetical protein [Thiocapsa sp. KS1]CRI66125.1 hypothetical protein THIOKS12640016 [Thiocapsa sp. KS1]